MQIAMKPLAEIRPYENNPRLNDAAVDAVVESIRRFGFRQPIVVDAEGVIVCGHTRWKAATKMGLAEAPVHVATDLSPEQVRAYRIADNKAAELSEWNLELLPIELAGLQDAGIDWSALGFGEAELEKLLGPGGTEGLTDPDAVPEPPAEATTAPGELIILGHHRLLCGDSTDAAAVARLLGGATPFMMVTDPPYGVEYDPEWRNRAGVSTSKRTGKVQNDDRADWQPAWDLFRGDVAYVWHASQYTVDVAGSLIRSEFELRASLIWRKQQLVMGRGHYHWQHEPAWYAVRKGRTAKWSGDRKQSTVWDIPNPLKNGEEATIHGTQKPVECMARPIRNHGGPGDAVYDPFLGSGTTLVACEMLGRTCFGMELDPVYCDVIVKRWEDFTGKAAERRTRDHESAGVR